MKPKTDTDIFRHEIEGAFAQMHAETFISQSNEIEGITRPPNRAEISEYHRFMGLEKITVRDLEIFVKAYQPNARLRDKVGLNVAIADFMPARGGPAIRQQLEALLERAQRPLILLPNIADNAFTVHVAYETLHPFTDGNGRSGRMLWAWQMQRFPFGFLRSWYFQSLVMLRGAQSQ